MKLLFNWGFRPRSRALKIGYRKIFWNLTFLNILLWYAYVIRNNKMHTFFINDLIQLYFLRHVSNIEVFILRKTCTCSFVVFISCIRTSRMSCRCQAVCDITHIYVKFITKKLSGCVWYHTHPESDKTSCLYSCMLKYHKAACTIFLRMNTWLFETCRGKYNWIISLMEKSVHFFGTLCMSSETPVGIFQSAWHHISAYMHLRRDARLCFPVHFTFGTTISVQHTNEDADRMWS